LAKGDIARLTMSYAKQIWSISSIVYVRWQHASRNWSWWLRLRLPFWGMGGHRGSVMVPFERAMVGSYRLSIVTVVISLNIRPPCHRMSPTLKSTDGGLHWGKNLGRKG